MDGSPPSVPIPQGPDSCAQDIEEWNFSCHLDEVGTEARPLEPGNEIDFLEESLAMTAIANKDFFLYLHPKESIESRMNLRCRYS